MILLPSNQMKCSGQATKCKGAFCKYMQIYIYILILDQCEDLFFCVEDLTNLDLFSGEASVSRGFGSVLIKLLCCWPFNQKLGDVDPRRFGTKSVTFLQEVFIDHDAYS